jgi:hypothetical protein
MPVADKIMALLDTLDAAELDRMRPADLHAFHALTHHWAMLADVRLQRRQRASGVLAQLKEEDSR